MLLVSSFRTTRRSRPAGRPDGRRRAPEAGCDAVEALPCRTDEPVRVGPEDGSAGEHRECEHRGRDGPGDEAAASRRLGSIDRAHRLLAPGWAGSTSNGLRMVLRAERGAGSDGCQVTVRHRCVDAPASVRCAGPAASGRRRRRSASAGRATARSRSRRRAAARRGDGPRASGRPTYTRRGSSWTGVTSSSPPSIANRRRSSCIGTYGRLLMNRRSCGAVHCPFEGLDRRSSGRRCIGWPAPAARRWAGAVAARRSRVTARGRRPCDARGAWRRGRPAARRGACGLGVAAVSAAIMVGRGRASRLGRLRAVVAASPAGCWRRARRAAGGSTPAIAPLARRAAGGRGGAVGRGAGGSSAGVAGRAMPRRVWAATDGRRACAGHRYSEAVAGRSGATRRPMIPQGAPSSPDAGSPAVSRRRRTARAAPR